MNSWAAVAFWAWMLTASQVLTGCAARTSDHHAADRERANIRLSLAQAYFEQGRHEVALEEVQRSLVIDPEHPPALVLHGLVLMAMNQPASAQARLDQALALDPRLTSGWHNRAWLLCQQGQWDAAMRDFDQAIALSKGSELAQVWRVSGVCLAQAQRWDQAEQRLSQALDLEPQHPVTRYQWAKVQQARGQWISAQWALQSLNASSDVNAQSLWLAIMGAEALGDASAVTRLAQQLEQQFPQSPQWDAYQRKAMHDR